MGESWAGRRTEREGKSKPTKKHVAGGNSTAADPQLAPSRTCRAVFSAAEKRDGGSQNLKKTTKKPRKKAYKTLKEREGDVERGHIPRRMDKAGFSCLGLQIIHDESRHISVLATLRYSSGQRFPAHFSPCVCLTRKLE